ncbi:MAG TPA: site-specific tyrosine recombinase XerD [Marinilabiliales bacterium]|jgi:integrase/recombinase XerD|nr:MAG: site-specific tyrosine recombinase XerD [Bacteroidetes bacterium GWA2_40_14]OFX61214.1 MAG: site-specific tyrosine recombinase XerD [Bacteroidetes bacterium GWC2_40_13]OFX75252.1 MAG: site-specific tyrosine recombinase XerD [Bacteroidetes bacterium GWD2_40_43]OFX89849.1 MAG: site-specific tyrosine recombinase XerD [Bacteroidetes bacterium GWE2_40_63]OFY21958.1 MAG: site-specific tyrosine recombinase XerD [Bacteroidetes bacterium GWF2_40_13]OFZ30305.1 MAG: site-specific tyrosine recombi
MIWADYYEGYKSYLQLEKSLSGNTVEAYLKDIGKFTEYLEGQGFSANPTDVTQAKIREFIDFINELGMSASSQARALSGIKSFFKYLLIQDVIERDPSALIETPKIGRKLPVVLSPDEVDSLIKAVELGSETGYRNHAILEVLYGCGLRVSELVNLRLTDVHYEEGFIKVQGKGNKERLIPFGKKAKEAIQIQIRHYRANLKIDKKDENILFLNRRGKKMTRVMIFTIIKDLAEKIGLAKNISPHTFRHSFATHLMEGGADLRAIQDMLGHESITTTEVYTHLDKEYLKDTILRFHPRS